MNPTYCKNSIIMLDSVTGTRFVVGRGKEPR